MCPTDFSDGHRFFYISNDSFVALRAEIFEKIFLKIYGAYGSEMNIINSYLWEGHELPWIDHECFINSKWSVCGNMC